MQVTVELTYAVCAPISKEAEAMGLTVDEFVKWLVGAWVVGQVGLNGAPRVMTYPGNISPFKPLKDPLAEMSNAFRLMMDSSGALSCPDCTQKVKMRDLEAGKCPHCGGDLGQEKGAEEGTGDDYQPFSWPPGPRGQ